MVKSSEVRFKSRPVGVPTADNFELVTVEVPDPKVGEVQVRNTWMSVDPYMRGRMSEMKSYAAGFSLGEVMEGGAIGTVVKSNDPALKSGDIVMSFLGWREVFNAPSGALQKIDTMGMPPQAFLGALGMPGLTAWVGLLKIAQLKAGDVVFVSGAAGAVGQVVCQIAKNKGNKVIGSAGGAKKCAYLKKIGCDEVIDYKAENDLTAALAKAAPEGIDVYFENVGGEHLEAALANARPFGRIAVCGMISQYNASGQVEGVRNLAMLLVKSLHMEGFIVSNHFDKMPEFMADMMGLVTEGKLTWEETIDEGIGKAPEAFLKLFKGENLGKMLVKLS